MSCLIKARFILVVLLFAPVWVSPGFAGASAVISKAKPYMSDVAQLSYARFMHEDGEYSRAIREYERVIELFPASPLVHEAHYNLATAYFESGDLAEAARQFRQFIENFEDSPFAGDAASLYAEVERKMASGKVVVLDPDKKPTKKKKRRKPVVRAKASVGIRAVQVLLFEGKTYGEIGAELDKLRRAGVDTVIVRVFHNPGDRYYRVVSAPARKGKETGVYFKTTHAPVVADLLGPVLKLAHRRGLKVFAWMTTRYADYGIETRVDLACVNYDIGEGTYGKCRGLDLFNEKAVRHLEALYHDLAAYDIDGILFQDDLVLRHNEGFGSVAAALYRRDTGRRLDPKGFYVPKGDKGYVDYTRSFWQWASWKNKRLLMVAKRLKGVVKKRNKRVRFAINFMYESVTNPPYALAWLSQDLEAAKRVGFDYYSIMAYHRQMAEELGKKPGEVSDMIVKMVEDATGVIGDPKKVLFKIQTVDWKTGRPVSDTEVRALLRKVKAAGDVSVAVVPYRSDFPFHALVSDAGAGRDGGVRPNKFVRNK